MIKPAKALGPPQGNALLRFGLRLPIWFYRLHLGWLLGNRFLLLEHVGRKSGLPRQTVIEMVRYDKTSHVCVVASGWGTKSDWFRNIQQTPDVTITVGARRYKAQATFLSEAEAAQELLDYSKNHPLAFRELMTLLGHTPLATAENCRELAKAMPLVAFQPH